MVVPEFPESACRERRRNEDQMQASAHAELEERSTRTLKGVYAYDGMEPCSGHLSLQRKIRRRQPTYSNGRTRDALIAEAAARHKSALL